MYSRSITFSKFDGRLCRKKLELVTRSMTLFKMKAARKKMSKQKGSRRPNARSRRHKENHGACQNGRAAYIEHRRLLEHCADVLGYSVHKMKKRVPTSLNLNGVPDPNTAMSTSSKFDGAHLFTGHVHAQIPNTPWTLVLLRQASVPPSSLNAETRKNIEMVHELSYLRLGRNRWRDDEYGTPESGIPRRQSLF